MPKKLVFDDVVLREAVASSTSFWMIARKLRPHRPRGIYKAMQRRIRELGLDTTHFTGRCPMPTRWSDEQLRVAVEGSTSVAQVIRKLGLVPAGGNYDQVQRRIRELDLCTAHFRRGAPRGTEPSRQRMPLERILVADRWSTSHRLKWRLFRAGLKSPACELCGWAQQAADGRIPVELDHINGDRLDNRLENLRILCPNCHSLQPTHRGLNKQSMRAKR